MQQERVISKKKKIQAGKAAVVSPILLYNEDKDQITRACFGSLVARR